MRYKIQKWITFFCGIGCIICGIIILTCTGDTATGILNIFMGGCVLGMGYFQTKK
jgi:hypothetical protein